jgi:hypothetical protein
MIRLSGLVPISAIGAVVGSKTSINEDEMDFRNEEDFEDPSNEGDHEGTMAKAQLLTLHKQASELYNMIGDDEGLEAWVQSKLTKASDYINAVYNHLQYEKSRPATIGSGDGAPADMETREV